jgi:hypothetical protein
MHRTRPTTDYLGQQVNNIKVEKPAPSTPWRGTCPTRDKQNIWEKLLLELTAEDLAIIDSPHLVGLHSGHLYFFQLALLKRGPWNLLGLSLG